MNNNRPVVPPTLGILIPCFNEEEVLPISLHRLTTLVMELKADGLITAGSFIGAVDDGSDDQTWHYLVDAAKKDANLRAISLSTNFGHQNALLCGLIEFGNKVDCMITLDADLQDDLGVIKSMLMAYNEGFDIIYGVRKKKKCRLSF